MKNVIVYSDPACPPCQDLKVFLDKLGIKPKIHNVMINAGAYQEMLNKNLGMEVVPTIDIEGTIIVGFWPDKIKKALGL